MVFDSRIRTLFLLAFLPTAWLSGCATTIVKEPSGAELERALGNAEQPPVTAEDLVYLSPRMREFVHNYTPAVKHSGIRMRELLRALIDVHGIEYEAEAHLTAEQAFEQRRANCLAFSSLVMAMAKEAGIKTRFQEVDLPPTWSTADENLLLQFRHVNVLVDHGNWRYPQVVDFRLARYDDTYPSRLIDSHQAVARFYNNLGIEAMLEQRYDEALDYVGSSLHIEPTLTFGWVNLGQIHRRMGDHELAEIAYRQALTLDSRFSPALSNMARLYEFRGDRDKALEFRSRARHSRGRDPYFRYAMAQRAFASERWQDANNWIEEAIKKRPNEHRFHHMAGLIRWQLGQRDSALTSLRRAAKLANLPTDIARYRQQLSDWTG